MVNCGLGAEAGNSKGLDAAMKDLAMITGQWPVKTKARKSVASFKIREGNTIGIAVTLRGRVSLIHCSFGLGVYFVAVWNIAA